jgi:beta-lactamase regulating signal transducer with metallopeptidase domain
MDTLIEIGLWNAAASAVLALLAAAVARVCRRPALAHALWLLVLLKLLTPPLVPFSLSLPAAEPPPPPAVEPADVADVDPMPAEEDEAAALPVEPEPVAPVSPPVPWQWWAEAVWLAGTALWAGWVVIHVVRFRRALRHARLAPGWLQDEAEELAERLGLRRCPDVWLVAGAVSPMVWALGRRPRLLFPSGLLDRLGADGRAALLAHELAHLRRRDHWVRLVELAATGLYWWLPVLWWARRELHEAEEQCCDAWGVWALGGEGRPYAMALLQTVAFVSQTRLPLPVGASGGVGQLSHLKRRLEMVMQGKTSRSLSWAGLGVALGIGLLLPLFPAVGRAQSPAPVPEPPAPVAREKRDQQIEDLKRALQILEAEKERERRVRAAQEAGALRVDDATLEAQLREVERVIAGKEKELQDLKAKAHILRAKVKGQESRPPTDPTDPKATFSRVPPLTAPPAATPEGRVDELEKKLDKIQKQLDDLQRALKRGATEPPAPGYRPGAAAPTPQDDPRARGRSAIPAPVREAPRPDVAPTPQVKPPAPAPSIVPPPPAPPRPDVPAPPTTIPVPARTVPEVVPPTPVPPREDVAPTPPAVPADPKRP